MPFKLHLSHQLNHFNLFLFTKTFFLTQFVVNFLADLYEKGESTYIIEHDDKKKMTNVIVKRTKYDLAPDALKAFEQIHDDWEMNICKKYPYDPLIGGNYNYYNL